MNWCPYCGMELMERYLHKTALGIEESLYQCPDEHYSEHYAFGGHVVNVCGWEFGWSQSEPKGLYYQIKAICDSVKQLRESESY